MKILDWLYIFFLLAFITIFIAKIIIQIILDRRNGYPIVYGSAWGHVSFLPYNKEVAEEDKKLKTICNKLQKLTIFSLSIFLFVFSIRILSSKGQ
ncbi:hypothetical protein KJS94_15035 [Flavihumibacter rivuli]|uniref:hypothetical protein n=1 Tax=Flavihumibacter rivuli TaxID=2838156 RepID=UPI001BDF350D|nr:hypothetical protein [Flavihumibacter rivuli]ULQ55963.1 hypothetical protein KJS94_15035 [Flavihumibacter rivuli]